MSIEKLREAGRLLRKAMECPHCGGSRMIAATDHLGHGTGVHGSANYRAIAFEQVTAQTHCTCPDGPVWGQIMNCDLAEVFRLADARNTYPAVEPENVAIWHPDLQKWCSVPAATWRQAVQEFEKERDS